MEKQREQRELAGCFAGGRIPARAALLLALAMLLGAQTRKTENIVLVTADGLRWQEVFRGIDPLLMREKEAGMKEAESLRQKLWAETAGQRRERLMPFFWNTLAPGGVALGNRDKGNAVLVTNRYRVSYPGYSELLTCRAQDEMVRGNDRILNPRQTALEFAREKMGLERGQVAVIASWDGFRFLSASREGAIFLNAGLQDAGGTPRLEELNRLQYEALTGWQGVRHDSVTVEMALEYLKHYRPRLLYVALDETDDWAHDRRYDRVLAMAQYFDRALEMIWRTVQSMDGYRDRTTLLVAADHGRGSRLQDWSRHGAKVKGAEYIWMAALGPDTPARGEGTAAEPVYQRDFAATLLALLGLPWQEFCGGQGRPVGLMVNAGGR